MAAGPAQPLVGQFGKRGVRFAVQHELEMAGGHCRLLQTMQFDVAQQQADKGAPTKNRLAVVGIDRSSFQLLQQGFGNGV